MLKQRGQHFADDIFFENTYGICSWISAKFVPINNKC